MSDEPSPPPEAPLTPAQAAFAKRRRLIPAIIGGALFIQAMDASVVANALPAIGRDFGENPLILNLVISVYLLSAAVFLPISGWIADRFGARRVFMFAIAAFALCSLLCGLAQNTPQLIAARFLQGFAGAFTMPVGRVVLLKSARKRDFVNALATLSMPALLGPVLGPPIGGFIVEFVSWRWVFFMSVPIATLGIVLTYLYVPQVSADERRPFDLAGFVLGFVALGGLVFGVQNSTLLPPPVTAGLIIGGAIAGILFVRHLRRAAHPILDLSVFRVPAFFVANVGGAFFRASVAANPFLTALLLQLGLGFSAFSAGAIACTSAAGAVAMKTVAPPILRRFGFRTVLTVNGVLTAVTMAAVGFFTSTTPIWLMIIVLTIAGLFRSLQFTALNSLSYGDIARERISAASAMASVTQQVVQSLGVSLAAGLVGLLVAASGATAITAAAIGPAFWAIGALTLVSVAFSARLSPDAGGSVVGRPNRPDQ